MISPSWSSSPAKILRRIRRMIFPDRVLGRSGTGKMAFGAANGPIDLRTWRIKSFLIWSLTSLPFLSDTKALTAWPVNSSATPTTAASATAAWINVSTQISKCSRYRIRTYDAQSVLLQFQQSTDGGRTRSRRRPHVRGSSSNLHGHDQHRLR